MRLTWNENTLALWRLLLGLCGCLPVPVAQDALDSLYEELQQAQTPQEQAPAGQVQEIEMLAGDGYF